MCYTIFLTHFLENFFFPLGGSNINATQYQNKNKSTKRNSEKHTSPVSNTTAQKSHDEIDIVGIQEYAKQSTSNSEN